MKNYKKRRIVGVFLLLQKKFLRKFLDEINKEVGRCPCKQTVKPAAIPAKWDRGCQSEVFMCKNTKKMRKINILKIYVQDVMKV